MLIYQAFAKPPEFSQAITGEQFPQPPAAPRSRQFPASAYGPSMAWVPDDPGMPWHFQAQSPVPHRLPASVHEAVAWVPDDPGMPWHPQAPTPMARPSATHFRGQFTFDAPRIDEVLLSQWFVQHPQAPSRPRLPAWVPFATELLRTLEAAGGVAPAVGGRAHVGQAQAQPAPVSALSLIMFDGGDTSENNDELLSLLLAAFVALKRRS